MEDTLLSSLLHFQNDAAGHDQGDAYLPVLLPEWQKGLPSWQVYSSPEILSSRNLVIVVVGMVMAIVMQAKESTQGYKP